MAIQAIPDILVGVLWSRHQRLATAGMNTDPIGVVLGIFALCDKGASRIVLTERYQVEAINIGCKLKDALC